MVNVIATPVPQSVGAELLGLPMPQSEATDGAAFAEALLAFLGNGVQPKATGMYIPVDGLARDQQGKAEQPAEREEQTAAGDTTAAAVIPIVQQAASPAVVTAAVPQVGSPPGEVPTDMDGAKGSSPVGGLAALNAERQEPHLVARQPIPALAPDQASEAETASSAGVASMSVGSASMPGEAIGQTQPSGRADVVRTTDDQSEESVQTSAARSAVHATQTVGAVAGHPVGSVELPVAARSLAAPTSEPTAAELPAVSADDQPASPRATGRPEVVSPAVAMEGRSIETRPQYQTGTVVFGQVQQSAAPSTTESGSEPDWRPPDQGPDIARMDAVTTAPTELRGVFQAAADRALETGQAARPELHMRVIDQVVKEVRLHTAEGQSNIVVRLNPPELGSLRLQISQDATGLTSQIQASTEQVSRLLQAHVPALVDALSGAGVKLESVTISSGPAFGALAQDLAQSNAQGSQYQPKRGNRRGWNSGQGFMPIQAATVNTREAGYSWLA